ncbi:SDR family oxidoreductase [Candidatus Aerophobetes bacterium]|nr:SDR family oxidoreductase [Candidatus Aerophobetes bacterium]
MNVLELFSLKGKVALVTGGAGLYGVTISTALGEAGASVVIASRNLNRCEKVAKDLRSKNLDVVAMPLDLSIKDSIIALKDRIVNTYGKIDILFNNAVARKGGSMDIMTAEEWEEPMKVNSTGLFLCSKIFIEEMVKQKSGSVINISSIYGIVGPDFSIYGNTGMTNPANYSFAKGGMIAFTRYLATYYAKYNIRVNCISPGGLFTNQPKEFVDNYIKRTPLGRMANEDDLKGAAVFLASDASSYITGHNLVVDGGWTIW